MKILGVKIDNLSLNEVLNKVEGFLKGGEPTTERGKQHYIVTLNPEFLVKAQKDKEFKEILNNADLSIPDGVGLVLALLLLGGKIKERITGIDLMEAICKKAAEKNWPIFLFGAVPGVAKKAGENLKERYKKIQINVIQQFKEYDLKRNLKRHGFFRRQLSQAKVVTSKAVPVPSFYKSPAILFVALGASKQEKWINENLKKMPNVKLAIGVGGAFDFISGKIKRAPKFMRLLGLEWLWRLIIQPWRIRRVFNAVIVFPWLVLKSKLMYNRNVIKN